MRFLSNHRRWPLVVMGVLLALSAAEAVSRWRWPHYGLAAAGLGFGHWHPATQIFRPSGVLGLERNPAGDHRVKEDGFRSRHIRFSDKPHRVLFVGDSLSDALTNGYIGSTAEETLSTREGRPVEIWDFSGAGYDMEHYRRILEYKCRDFKPDTMAVIFCLNDTMSFHVPVVFIKDGQIYSMQGVALSRDERLSPLLFRWSQLYRFLYLQRHRKRTAESDPRALRRQFLQTTRFIEDWCRRNGVRLFFVAFPLFKPMTEYTPEEERALGTVNEAFRKSRAPSLRLWERFPPRYWETYRNRTTPGDIVHPDPSGYEAAAEIIIDFMVENWDRSPR